MKLLTVLIGGVALCAASVSVYLYAQPPHDGRRPARDPFFQLFDTDQDGELSSDEIANASSILESQDRDQNGVLTPEELPRPPRDHRQRDLEQRDHRQRGHDQRGHDRPQDQRVRQQSDSAGEIASTGTVVLTGGYRTDPRDHGRPVALIAAALGVESEVFRDAFSGVRPSSFGPPTASRARANKKVLMDALGKHGVTNDRLDEVSNRYRYRPGAGRLWPHRPASAQAIIEDGQLTGLKIVDPGYGYLTAPDAKVVGYEDVKVHTEIEFGEDFNNNGRLSKLTIVGNE